MSGLSFLFLLSKRECIVLYRSCAEGWHAFIFFLIVVTLFPLTLHVGAALETLIAPGMIWMATILSVLLLLPHLFREDFEEGTLAQMLLSPVSLMWMVCTKIAVHWIAWTGPLFLVVPLVGWILGLHGEALEILLLTLLLGTPIVYLMGALVAALSVGSRKSSVLIPLVVLPLFVPVLIFSCGSVHAVQTHISASVPILLLSAMLVLALTFIPTGIAAALRMSVLYEASHLRDREH